MYVWHCYALQHKVGLAPHPPHPLLPRRGEGGQGVRLHLSNWKKMPEPSHSMKAKFARRIMLIFALGFFFLGACLAPPPPLEDAQYFNSPAREVTLNEDEADLAQLVQQWARGAGREAPLLDAGLTLVCRDFVWRLHEKGAPAVDNFNNAEMQNELTRAGIADSAIRTQMAVASAMSALQKELKPSLEKELSEARYTHYGLGAFRSWLPPRVFVALIFSRRPVALDPFPKRVPLNDRQILSGTLLEGLKEPRVFISPPSGVVHDLLFQVDANGRFRSSVFFGDGPGVYRLEVSAEGSAGPEIVALMPILAGDTETPQVAAPEPDAADENDARRQVWSRINEERAAAGLKPVSEYIKLEAVAQAHAEEMRKLNYVAHRSPNTGMASDRADAAGILWRKISENVALNQTALSAHASLMESPAHRTNVIDPDVTHIGIGVAFSDDGHGHRQVYLVENFAALR